MSFATKFYSLALENVAICNYFGWRIRHVRSSKEDDDLTKGARSNEFGGSDGWMWLEISNQIRSPPSTSTNHILHHMKTISAPTSCQLEPFCRGVFKGKDGNENHNINGSLTTLLAF